MHEESAAPERRVIIVGAGLAGSLLAVLLGRRGWAVEVLERRGDPRDAAAVASEQRSINLGLSHRGMTALRTAGVLDRVLGTSVRARGRVIHASDGRVEFQPYGQSEHEVLHSIQRVELNRALIDRAEEVPGVVFRFGVQLDGMDRDAAAVDYRLPDGTPGCARGDFVVGADGAFSSVRQWMQRGSRADYAQEFLEWGYKELTLPAAPGGGSPVELEALHIWPRGDCLIVSHPNPDGSHTLTLFLPWEGRRSFAVLQTPEDVTAFFANLFPDLPPLAPGLAEEFFAHPTGSLVTTRTFPWHHRDRVVLVGDGCHAVYPFYGQGMNAALEDCLVLDQALARHPDDRTAAFRAYQDARKCNTDALAELAKQNFVELRDTANQPQFLARKQLDLLLSRLFPSRWMPLYTMVVHTTMPYAEAMERQRKQELILRRLGVTAVLSTVFPVASAVRRLVRRRSAAPARS